MSVSLWAYKPEKCDGDFCPMDCENCSKNFKWEGVMTGDDGREVQDSEESEGTLTERNKCINLCSTVYHRDP